ncbi:hypothetical protein QTI66_30725 [Variovorax sp. J22R133]|uniref:hypothetical protein n=1 Tax=Variovorax brevis TaxID=3053503 RepID=UPI0025780EF0|nr:hypothetical protein [Variovorax sp. J22R133]MDM0116524.1 hypothetical protein [Variovorax sp. J22R133]
MKKNLLALAAATTLAFAASNAMAEAKYNQAAGGTGTVTATAGVNLSVTVPKLIVLRVGSNVASQNTLSWTAAFNIPGALPSGTVPTTGTPNVDWNGTDPTITLGTQPAALTVWAWTNGTGANINCAVGTWSAANGPANSAFKVATTGTLPHPGNDLGTCTQTNFSQNTVVTGTWTYTLDTATAAAWKAGAYTAAVTYTAQGL